MATVVKQQPGQSVDQLIRQFQKKVQNEGILQELRKKEFYVKPSTRRQQKMAQKKRKIARTARGY